MAASMAISSPLLDNVSIQGAKGILINFTGGKNMKLTEINEAAGIIHQEAGEEAQANIIFGMIVDENMQDCIRVTVIATGLNRDSNDKDQPAVPRMTPGKPSPEPLHEKKQAEIITREHKPKPRPVEEHKEQTVQEDLFKNLSGNDLTDIETPAWIRKNYSLNK
jgi:cell division protein FtsZ